ncbi:hypothetical protein H9P43_010077 [Blastocladiella emersonii ATCC 22665]|nr:hypothetical protein H9P43_010077 [Blastocladiella emersonii ATCC 22665]
MARSRSRSPVIALLAAIVLACLAGAVSAATPTVIVPESGLAALPAGLSAKCRAALSSPIASCDEDALFFTPNPAKLCGTKCLDDINAFLDTAKSQCAGDLAKLYPTSLHPDALANYLRRSFAASCAASDSANCEVTISARLKAANLPATADVAAVPKSTLCTDCVSKLMAVASQYPLPNGNDATEKRVEAQVDSVCSGKYAALSVKNSAAAAGLSTSHVLTGAAVVVGLSNLL